MDSIVLQRMALEARSKLGVDGETPIDILNLIKMQDEITFILFPFKENISGICIKEANLIVVNSTSTLGRQAFSLAHELFHYYYDDENRSISYLESKNISKKEKDADIFASYFLMPDVLFTKTIKKLVERNKNKINLDVILELEHYFGVSRSTLLVRLVHEGYLKEKDADVFKTNIIKNAIERGYDTKLYLFSNNGPITYGEYLKLALKLKNTGKISEGKYNELLLDAFRSDILYEVENYLEIYD